MTRKHIILQGFVDINLELDENINTKITLKELPQKTINTLDLNSGFIILEKTEEVLDRIELPVSVEFLFESLGINLSSVQAIHVQGSRLYGVDDLKSDWDLAVISTDVIGHEFKEINIDGIEFDLHIYSKEDFQSKLDNHEIHEIEFLSHPEKFFIINNKDFYFDINNDKFINMVKSESDKHWNKGKKNLDLGNNSYKALKNIWHSFKFLIFAEQILKDGKITDFSAANYLYESIVNSKQINFDFFELNFSSMRDVLKLNLDIYKNDNEFDIINF